MAHYGVLVLVPYAFSSREKLATNAATIGSGNPLVARIMCVIAMVFVFVMFIAVTLLHQEVTAIVRLGGVLSVLGVGIFSAWRARQIAQQQKQVARDALAEK